jgi:hypothetical protein
MDGHACTPCFGKFPCSVRKFLKAPLVLESCYVVFWKVFKSSIAACLNTVFVFFLEDEICGQREEKHVVEKQKLAHKNIWVR